MKNSTYALITCASLYMGLKFWPSIPTICAIVICTIIVFALISICMPDERKYSKKAVRSQDWKKIKERR